MVDGDVRLSFTEFAAEIDRAARALIATGVEPGDRVAIWAPNMYEWAVAALGTHAVGGVVIPLNTRFKGTEAGYVIGAAKRQAALHGDRLPRHRLRRAAPKRAGNRVDRGDRHASRRGARRLHAWDDFMARADDRRSGDRPLTARCGGRARRPVRHPVHVGHDRRAEGSDARSTRPASARSTTWSDVVGLREGDRYLVINPFFHAFGLKAGILACAVQGRDDRPASRLRRPLGDAPRGRGAHLDAAGAARDLPDDPQPSRPRGLRPVVAAAVGHRRGADHRRR